MRGSGPHRPGTPRLGVYLPLVAVLGALSLFGLAYSNKSALLRRVASGGGRALSAESSPDAPAPDVTSTLPNCGIPSAPAPGACKAEQTQHYDANKAQFWGVGGFDRTMGSLFNRFDGKLYFPWGRPITIVHVGAHGGSMLERYSSLMRGPRLDDRIIMVDANPLAIERLSRRIRMDPRLSLLHAAVYAPPSGVDAWFEYAAVPNTNTGGKVHKTMPLNFTADVASGKGAIVRTITLDDLLAKIPGHIDFLMMDVDGHEPWVLEGASVTLARTRLAVFNCNEHWGDSSGTGKGGLLDYVKNVFTPAGLSVTLLGEKRSVLLDAAAMPDAFATALPTWGFCLAAHTSPPAVTDIGEFSGLLAGSDAKGGPCAAHAGALVPSSLCKAGVLASLGAGIEGEGPPPGAMPVPPTVFY